MYWKVTHTILILIVVFITTPSSVVRLVHLDTHLAWFGFFVLYAVSFLSIWWASTVQHQISKMILAVILVLSTWFGFGYETVSGSGISIYLVELVLEENSQILSALNTYFTDIVVTLVVSLAVILGLFFTGTKVSKTFNSPVNTVLIWTIFLSPVFVQSMLLYSRGGKGLSGLPNQHTVISYVAFYKFYQWFLQENLQRMTLTDLDKHSKSTKNKFNDLEDIVVIVDESIRGDLLDINSDNGIETGISELSYKMINYGVASSATNCSATTNLVMRTAASRNDPVKSAYRNAYIWEYALAAGYQTVLIDAQVDEKKFQNYMTDEEMSFINHWFVFTGLKDYEKDAKAGELLAELLTNDKKEFIYIQKMGAHFPYKSKYPSNDELENGESFKAAGKDDFSGNEWFKDYQKAVNWSSTSFFDSIQPLSLFNAILFYTSDHGQYFLPGNEQKSTHCNSGLVDGTEGKVPLVLFTEHAELRADLLVVQKRNFNHASHFEIGSTLKVLFGFLEDKSNDTLFQPIKNEPRFISNFNVKFGEKIVWNRLDHSR